MESEIEKRRKIDQILLPPIKKANALATNLKERSDLLRVELARTEALLAKRRRAKTVSSQKKPLSTFAQKRVKLK